MTAALWAAGLSGIDPGDARGLLRAELTRPEYRVDDKPVLQRLLEYAFDKLGGLLERTAGSVFGGPGGLLLLGVIILAVVVGVRLRIGPLARLSRGGSAPAVGGTRSAEGHRAEADAAAAQGRFADAVRERLRAVVRALEESGVLDVRPGRTALEVARDATASAPTLGAPLTAGAVVFDEIWSGGRAAGADDDAALRALDDRVVRELHGVGRGAPA